MSDPEPTPGPSNPRKHRDINFLTSPIKKRLKRGDVSSNEKNIAINIYKYVERNTPTFPVKADIMKTTAEIMGVSIATITRILSEYKTTGAVSSPDRAKPKFEIIAKLDDFILSAIRRKVHQFYFNNELPTVDKVLKAINDDGDLPNFKRTTLFKIIRKLNFKFEKRSRKSILLDRPDLMIWRRNYLLKIKDFRKENRKIYYTDETWVNEGNFFYFEYFFIPLPPRVDNAGHFLCIHTF